MGVEDQPFTLCPYCGERVEASDPDTVYAVERRELPAMGAGHIVDGMGGYFHPSCPPEPVGYARRPRPKS